MPEAFICDGVRTPIGRYGGGLAKVRTDDLAAVPLKALMKRNPNLDWTAIDEVVFGCANQAGEDNRNVARMALLLAGLPDTVPGVTVNRLCASGLNAVGYAAQAIRAGEMDLAIAGGVESMTRAPLVMGKAQEAFQRSAQIEDTTIGWRFINPLMKKQYGVDAMPETAENVAEDYQVGAQGPGRFRASLAAARHQGAGQRFLRRGDRASDRAGRQGGAYDGGQGRAHPSGDHDGGLGEAEELRARPRHRHGRKRVGRQRRRRRDAGRLGGRGEQIRPQAGRAHHRHGVGRRAAARHGHRAGAVDPQADGAAQAQDRRLRRDRAERGVRLAGAGLPAPAWAFPTTPSTSIRTAVRSRSAIRSACRGRGSPSPRRITW